MKKIISILFIICVLTAAFAADGATFKGITAVDSRSHAMGGTHVADTSDYFTLLRNPAGLAFSGRHNLVGQTNINIGGPLSEALAIVQEGNYEYAFGDGLMDTAKNLIQNNKLNLGLSLGGPIALGGTYKNGFGWGLFDQVIVGAAVPSTIAKINSELDVDLVLGYGKNIDLGLLGNLAFGISSDIYAQAPYVDIKKNVIDLLSGDGDITSRIMNSLIMSSSAGINLNAGVQYRFLGMLNAALVYDSFFSAYKGTSVVFDPDNFDPMALIPVESDLETAVGKGTLNFGVGIDVPTGWTLGLISSLGVYADVKDVFAFLKDDPLERNKMLNVGIGAEVTLLKCISLRGGVSEGYLNCGAGLRLFGLNIDASIYGKELGMEPGATSQLNASLSIGIRH